MPYRIGNGMKTKTMLLLLPLVASACVPAAIEIPAPSSPQEQPSLPGETPSPQVLADCFITFELSAWHDRNGNGEWDPAEPPLEGAAFRVNGRFASVLSPYPCFSDERGTCQFRTWAPGECAAADYSITADPPGTFVPTTPSEITMSLMPTDFRQSAQFGFKVNDD